MVCGPAGLGKTSFVRLFMNKFNKTKAEAELKKRGKLLIMVIFQRLPHPRCSMRASASRGLPRTLRNTR